MVRYKRTPRKGRLTGDARAFRRSLYGASPPSRVRFIETKESRVVGPIGISDDEETATPTHSSGNIPQPLDPSDPLHLVDHEEVPAPPLQPVGPSAPTADPSPLSTNDIWWELADIRREINAALADIAKTLKDNKKFY